MNTEVITTSHVSRPTIVADQNAAIGAVVKRQEKLERLLPTITFWAVFGLFVLMTLGNRHRDWLGITLGAILTYVIARLVVRGVRALVLEPLRRIRFDLAASRLMAQLQGGHIAVGPFSWTLGAPGAMAMSRSGEVIILERGHGYQPLQILPHQLADVRVECNSRQFTQTLHSGRTTIGGFGKSFGMGYTMGGASTAVTNTINEYFLKIRYQLEKNGPVRTVLVPGGPERRVVEELCATIRRLEA